MEYKLKELYFEMKNYIFKMILSNKMLIKIKINAINIYYYIIIIIDLS